MGLAVVLTTLPDFIGRLVHISRSSLLRVRVGAPTDVQSPSRQIYQTFE